MAPLRSLLALLILAGLIGAGTALAQAPVEWYSDSSGGAIAGAVPPQAAPAPKGGGGAVAPASGAANTTPSVNLPPPAEAPEPDGVPAQAARAHARAAARAPAARPAAAQVAIEQPAEGGLPFTGLELGALVLAGLCLLVGGAALRPRAARR